mgnify:CR=1 FL=1
MLARQWQIGENPRCAGNGAGGLLWEMPRFFGKSNAVSIAKSHKNNGLGVALRPARYRGFATNPKLNRSSRIARADSYSGETRRARGACRNFGVKAVEVYLHIGAHRTGTSALQAWMVQNADLMARHGTVLWGPERTRGGLFAGLIKRPDLLTHDDITQARRSATALRMDIDRLRDRGVQRLIISEENCIGVMPQCLDLETLYPDSFARLQRIVEAFGADLTGLALSIRRYDLWWSSALAVGLARGGAAPPAQTLARLADHPPGWAEGIAPAQSAANACCAGAKPKESTRSARFSPAWTGSRRGPAGRQRPLPKPRWASTTTIEKSLTTEGF